MHDTFMHYFVFVPIHCFFEITTTFTHQCKSLYHKYYTEVMPTKLCIVPLSLSSANQYYSYSPALGSGSGTPFSSKEEGSITGVKVWENPNSHITG